METTNEPNAASSASVIGGLLTRDQLAKDLGCTTRTVIRREHQGLPVIRIGMARLYNPESVRAWLLTHEQRHDIPKRGRPAKHAA